MRKVLAFVGGAAMVLLSACTAEPVAIFDFSYSDNAAPAEVTFNNLSTDADSYRWDFGDGGSSNEANPTYTYTTPGTYNVVLYAKGRGGEANTAKSITIEQATSYLIRNQSSYTLYNAFSFTWDGENIVETTSHGNLFAGSDSDEVFTDLLEVLVSFESVSGTQFLVSGVFTLNKGFRNFINITDETYIEEITGTERLESRFHPSSQGSEGERKTFQLKELN
jgi:PKD repeat protein